MKHSILKGLDPVRVMVAFLAVAVITLMPCSAALAQGVMFGGGDEQVFDVSEDRLRTGFSRARNIVYIVGGLGAIGLGVGAFFGRFKWGWFFSLLGGIAVIALVVEGVSFVVGGDGNTDF